MTAAAQANPPGPRGVGELLDATFGVYRRHFVVFAGLGILLLVPEALLSTALSALLPEGVPLQLGAGALGGFAGTMLMVAQILASVDAAHGRPPSMGRAVRRMGERLGSVVAITIVYWLVGLLLAVTVVGLPFMVRFWVSWSLAYHACLVEDAGVRASLDRSRELVRGSWWRTFGIGMVVMLLSMVVLVALFVPAIAIVAVEQGGDPSVPLSLAATVLSELSFVLGSALASPIAAIAWTLLYFDLRVRKEGLDLQMRADELAAPAGGS